jgi:hypothetical protein
MIMMVVMIMIVIVVVVVIMVIIMSMMFVIVIMPMIVMIVFARKCRYWKQRGSNYRANQSKLAKHLGGLPSCR